MPWLALTESEVQRLQDDGYRLVPRGNDRFAAVRGPVITTTPTGRQTQGSTWITCHLPSGEHVNVVVPVKAGFDMVRTLLVGQVPWLGDTQLRLTRHPDWYNVLVTPLVQVFVRSFTGSTLTISVGLSDDVEMLTVEVSRRATLPPHRMRLTFLGQQLEYGNDLRHYNIQPQSTVDLSLRLPGGAGDHSDRSRSPQRPSGVAGSSGSSGPGLTTTLVDVVRGFLGRPADLRAEADAELRRAQAETARLRATRRRMGFRFRRMQEQLTQVTHAVQALNNLLGQELVITGPGCYTQLNLPTTLPLDLTRQPACL